MASACRVVEEISCLSPTDPRVRTCDRIMSSQDAVWREMSRQVSLDRLQQLAVAVFNGAGPRPLTEAEQYFFDRLCAEAELHPDAVIDLLHL